MKNIHTNKIYQERRKELRNNSTVHERILWSYLRGRNLGYKFQRQHSIGPYITDFYCAQKRLVIELDGHQHIENKEYDLERTNYLESLKYKVLRFWNDEINNNMEGVILKIRNNLKITNTPPLRQAQGHPSLAKEGRIFPSRDREG